MLVARTDDEADFVPREDLVRGRAGVRVRIRARAGGTVTVGLGG